MSRMGDTISRQAAIDALRKMQTYKMVSGDDMLLIDQAGAMTELMLLPPAEPKRGKWVDDGDPLMLTCGNCGYGVMRYNNTPFCPSCGAKMERRTVAIVGRRSGKSAAQLEEIKKELGLKE